MDFNYCNENSRNRETIDFLRPPVQRNIRNSYEDYLGYVNSSDTTISSKNENVKFTQCSSSQKNPQEPARPSLSLVLQKICEKKIFEEFALNRNSSLKENQTDDPNSKGKPTLTITVIPKKNRDLLFKVHDTKNQTTEKNNKDSHTSSNDSSVSADNIYLIVAGKKDKVYRIKATTGNKIFHDKPKHVAKCKDVKTETKRFPLKMEKKKNKSMNLEGKCEPCFSHSNNNPGLYLEDIHPNGSSRVKIVGRIGLNKNDRYVMECAATVNGQPVKTSYIPTKSVPVAPERIVFTRPDTITNSTPFTYDTFNDCMGTKSGSTTSQATQADGNMQIKSFGSTTDRNTQCNLCELCNNTENINFEDEFKASNLNRSTSPLVIISVYPKSEIKTYAIGAMDSMPVNRYDKKNYTTTPLNGTVRSSDFEINTELYNVRDKSPNKMITRCCPCEPDLKTDTQEEYTKPARLNIPKTNKATRSPSPVKRSPISKTRDAKKEFLDTNSAEPKSRSASPNILKTNNKIDQRDAKLSKQTKNVFTKGIDIKKQYEKPRSKLEARDKSVSTVTKQSVKLTKKATDNMSKSNAKHDKLTKNDVRPFCETLVKKSLPETNISKVSINIESDREQYDVVFEKRKTSTDLTVKRTAKDNFSQKYFQKALEDNYENRRHLSDSLENFFPIPEAGRHRRSASQAFINENIDVLTTNMSRLNVRDSLEIGHRRDQANRLYVGHETGSSFYDPVKHFPGDDCMVDPIERDKEIRELLGVDKKRKDAKDALEVAKHKINRNNVISRRCISHNKMCKPVTKRPKFIWPLPSYTNESQNDNNINILKKDEEKSITDDEKQNLMKFAACTKIRKQNVNLKNKLKIAIMTKQQSSQCIGQEILHLMRPRRGISLHSQQKQKVILLSGTQYRKVKKLLHRVNGESKKLSHRRNRSIVSIGNEKPQRRKNECLVHFDKDAQTESFPKDLDETKSRTDLVDNSEEKHTVVLFCKEKTAIIEDRNKIEGTPLTSVRGAASSIEIRYTSIAYSEARCCGVRPYDCHKNIKHESALTWKKRDSIETIFKGRKKTRTPNLGTSSLSLQSEEMKSNVESLPTEKARKPFLRRLMSCLVMRSETTELMPPVKKPEPSRSANSSVDSYRISTSLLAIDMSSSIYDTSASFYSNHSIGVINNKTKRGFFSSVREFLTTKKI